MNSYDEIKSLLKRSRLLQEQTVGTNIAKSIEDNIEDDVYADDVEGNVDDIKKEKTKTYRISGGLLSLHGVDKKELQLTTEEKTAFQETMDEFVKRIMEFILTER